MTTVPAREGIIYGLSCTCHPDDGIRYVGQTRQDPAKRLMQHRVASQYARGRKYPVSLWIAKHGRGSIEMQVLERTTDLERLDQLEIQQIKAHGTFGTDPGLNVTLGGGGTRGVPGVKGEENSGSRLTNDEAREVYDLVVRAELPQSHIAEVYGISKQTVTKIIQGKSYANLGLDPLGDQRSHMPHMLGESNRNSKLTNAQVLEIHKRHSLGERSDDLALEYGVSVHNVNRIAKGVSHPHLNLTNISRGRRPPRKTGESNVGAKLNEGQVREIHRRVGQGERIAKLRAEFGVGDTAIRSIASGKTWRHLSLGSAKSV